MPEEELNPHWDCLRIIHVRSRAHNGLNSDITPCLFCAMNGHGRLFDHHVGAGEDGEWDRQTDFLSGLQIDDQFESSRLLDG